MPPRPPFPEGARPRRRGTSRRGVVLGDAKAAPQMLVESEFILLSGSVKHVRHKAHGGGECEGRQKPAPESSKSGFYTLIEIGKACHAEGTWRRGVLGKANASP
eukprot:1184407-Prorocentrum_minimum.AAC.2